MYNVFASCVESRGYDTQMVSALSSGPGAVVAKELLRGLYDSFLSSIGYHYLYPFQNLVHMFHQLGVITYERYAVD